MTDKKNNNMKTFTEGPILGPLVRFALPVLFALFLQAMYGAVDLLIVGWFGTTADVSAVSTGSQITMTFTNIINSFAMGTTILLGQQIGGGRRKDAGETIGASLFEFIFVAVLLTAVLTAGAGGLAAIMQAPEQAFDLTVSYVRICGAGSAVIIAYVLIGSIFRGMGDSRTPLITVFIACVCNIAGDLLLVGWFGMGTAGAAIATVFAQAISVVLSLLIIRRQALPFDFHLSMVRLRGGIIRTITRLGAPIALQDALVGISFLVILAIVNNLGVVPSAGVGVAEKVCAFIMLVPSAFMQSMAAFIAQNAGARKYRRALRALRYAVILSLCIGAVMAFLSFFHGEILAGIFSKDPAVTAAAASYLKAYAIDCLLTPFFFCYIGFYNGIGLTTFVMFQGIISAFCVRIPVAFLMSKIQPVSLFLIGLSTPCSSALQIAACLVCMAYAKRRVFDWEHGQPPEGAE